jgi:hypothetical protein
VNDFYENLAYANGRRGKTDSETLRSLVLGCDSIATATREQERHGIDFVLTLRRGAQVLVDIKTRKPGCSRFWRHGFPELALEIWSVMPGGKYNTPYENAKPGWTLSEHSLTDLVLFTFPPGDYDEVFLIGFQHLRMAFRYHLSAWMQSYIASPEQTVMAGRRYESLAVFVPVPVVIKAVDEVSCQPSPDPDGPKQRELFS